MLSALTVAVGAGLAFSQAPIEPAPAGPAAAPAQKVVRFLGRVESVDADANTITLKSPRGESKTFTIPSGVKIMAGEAVIAIGELKVGVQVAVRLDNAGTVQAVAVLMHRHHRHEGNGAEKSGAARANP